MDTGEVVHRLKGHVDGVRRVAFRPDGLQLACGTGAAGAGHIVLWKLPTGERERVLKGLDGWGNGFEELAYSPDGTRLAGAASDFRIFVWNPHTGKEIRKADGYAYDMAFSPDSRYLATAAVDQGKIKLWDIDTDETLGPTLETHAEIRTLAFDGNRHLAGGRWGHSRLELAHRRARP